NYQFNPIRPSSSRSLSRFQTRTVRRSSALVSPLFFLRDRNSRVLTILLRILKFQHAVFNRETDAFADLAFVDKTQKKNVLSVRQGQGKRYFPFQLKVLALGAG